MIGYLKGTVMDVTAEAALVDVSGVGYELTCSLGTLSHMQGYVGTTMVIWVYTHVREDALTLFGFLDRTEKQLFLSLLKVNGIGPKLAINALSGASVDQIFSMIESEDVKALSKLPKVGKKTAEQMILTLKGKLVSPTESLTPVTVRANKEIFSALVNLGFKTQEVERVVSDLPKDIDLQDGIRQGLAVLSGL